MSANCFRQSINPSAAVSSANLQLEFREWPFGKFIQLRFSLGLPRLGGKGIVASGLQGTS